MSFCLLSPTLFSAAEIPSGRLPARETRRLQQSGADFILTKVEDLSYWIEAHFANCSHDDLARIFRAAVQDPQPGLAWLMCSPNPLKAFQKLGEWDLRLHPENYARYDGRFFRIDLRKLNQGQRSLELAVVSLVLLYTEVLEDAGNIRVHLPVELRSLGRYLEQNSMAQVLPSDGDVFFEVPVAHADDVTMHTYNPFLEGMLPRRPTLAIMTRTTDALDEVRLALRATITEPDFSLDDLAEKLGASRRTLQRRLAVAGTSFTALRDQIRMEMLQDGFAAREGVETLVERLGFRDASAIYKLKRRMEAG